MELSIAIIGLVLAITGTFIMGVRSRKFLRVSVLWMVAILFFFGCVGSTFFAISLSNHPAGTGRGNFVSDTSISGLTTNIEWPKDVVKEQSFNLSILITPTSALTVSATAESGRKHAVSQLTPVGTPNVPITKAYGPKFDAFVSADLSASAFDISPPQQAKQSLDQSEVQFNWTLTPKYIHYQTLYIALTGVWIPQNGGQPIERPLMGHLLNINVNDIPQPPFTFGQITLSELFATLLGSVLNIPWIVELIKKRKEVKKEKADTSSSAVASPKGSELKEPTTVTAIPSGTQHTPSNRQKKKKR